MGTEYELKFKANPEALYSVHTTFPARWQTVQMETAYYDTPDHSLSARRWTLRRRMENEVSVCTLKTPGVGHGCGEFEVLCEEILEAVPLLLAQGAPAELEAMVRGGIHPSCGARFTRLAGLLEIPGGKAELALDRGVLLGGGKELPLCEMELELKSGDQEALMLYARVLASRFHLTPERKSKFVRAMELAQGL